MTTPKTAQQVNDPQTGQVITSRHSALSELMIQNLALREQLRILQAEIALLAEGMRTLQTSYDALSQMKEKQVASRIEVDELKEENDSLKAENARLAASCAEMAEACRQICSPIRPHWRATLEAASTALSHYNDGTALNDLLEPTIKLLERLVNRLPLDGMQITAESCEDELARLRGVVERNP